MFYYHFHKDGHNSEYIAARQKLDSLFRGIIAGEINSLQAIAEYNRIEEEFIGSNQQETELFRMIYSSRIQRLCRQFAVESQ